MPKRGVFSLFDSLEERYSKLRNCARKSIINQVGESENTTT